MTEAINKDNFKAKTKEGCVIVDFWAEWCGPCKRLAPIFDELGKEYGEKMSFYKVNVDENGELAQGLGVLGIPCMIVFKDGAEIDRIVGAMAKEQLKAKIDQSFE